MDSAFRQATKYTVLFEAHIVLLVNYCSALYHLDFYHCAFWQLTSAVKRIREWSWDRAAHIQFIRHNLARFVRPMIEKTEMIHLLVQLSAV